MSQYRDKKIGVLMGGLSREREVSLKTGAAIASALEQKGYQVVKIDCARNVIAQLQDAHVDVAFLALHGTYGEDGSIQGILEWYQIPYTGSGLLASALAMDKAMMKKVLATLSINQPAATTFYQERDHLDQFIKMDVGQYPLIVKPAREGSTINLNKVENQYDLRSAIEQALQSDSKVLIEEYIDGPEVTVSLLNGKVLPVIEIEPKSGFYDYEAKYTKGMTDYIVPARLSDEETVAVQKLSETIYHYIEASGAIRVDYIIDRNKKIPYFLEVNTMPGMTETSLVPKAALAAGIGFPDLVEEILNTAGLKVKG